MPPARARQLSAHHPVDRSHRSVARRGSGFCGAGLRRPQRPRHGRARRRPPRPSSGGSAGIKALICGAHVWSPGPVWRPSALRGFVADSLFAIFVKPPAWLKRGGARPNVLSTSYRKPPWNALSRSRPAIAANPQPRVICFVVERSRLRWLQPGEPLAPRCRHLSLGGHLNRRGLF
jgi:hypothetical protein